MPEPILLALILIPLLLGGVLFAVLRSQNRREPLQARLKSMMATAAVEAAPSLLSSGPSTQKTGGSGPLRMLRTLRTRLNTELLATGNRIGLLHLALAGFIAAAALLLFSLVLLGITPEKAAVLCGAAALATPVFLLRHSQRRYQNRFLDLFPDALDLIGRAVKAGLPVLDAMEVATQAIPAPVGSEFRRTLDEVRIGVEITTALRHAAERVRVPEFRFYVVGIGLQNRTGGSLTDTLANLSHVIRRRKELRLKIRAFTAESKMSVMVLSALPFIAGGLQLLINYDLMVTLFTDPRGRFMVGLALASLVSGTAVMAYIIKRAMR
jgi:tight adherence protein B